jgi:hypothetical protein
MSSLLALICAVSPFDSLAQSTREALATSLLPGFVSAHRNPRTGWSAVLEGPFGTTATCVQAPASSVVCTRSEGHASVEFPGLARFFELVAAPNDAWVTIEVASKPEGHALLHFRNGEMAEHRLVLFREGLVVTEPLPGIAATAPVIEVMHSPLLVLAFSEGGNGNNASGTVSYRLLQLIEDGPRVSFGTVIPLGGGAWGRAVTDHGFMLGSSVDVGCPTFKAPFVTTRRVCEGDVDPRSAPTLATLCERTAPCRRARTEGSPRIGRWSVRPRSLAPLSGVVRRDDSAVRISEIADVHALDLSDVELTNTTSVAQDVSETTLGASNDESGLRVGSCVLAPGETLVISREFERADCRLEDGQLSIPSTLVLRRGTRVISRLNVSLGDEDEPEFEVRPSWQLDPTGRGCVALPSLGHPNRKCPRHR